jgi:Ran GTPase-activating protein (RanGAP) involved in mRNA processing and transport
MPIAIETDGRCSIVMTDRSPPRPESPGIAHCQLTEEEFRLIFQAKSEDYKIQVTDKLFRRFERHHQRKPFFRIFEMESCCLGPRAAQAIVDIIIRHPSIRVLYLAGNAIGNAGCAPICQLLATTQVISLDLSSNSLTDSGVAELLRSVAYNKSLFSLKLGSCSAIGRNSCGPEAIPALARVLAANSVLSELDLTMCELSTDAVSIIAECLARNHSLHVLNLANNNLQSRGGTFILSSCVRNRLKSLNLSGNHLKDDIAPALGRFLSESRTARVLDLSSNGLTARFALAIAPPLASGCMLEELSLSGNPLTGRGLAALGPALVTNGALRVLAVQRCKIDPAGFGEFCGELEKNTALVRVNFGHNALRDDGSKRIAPVLEVHPSLRDVNMDLCEIGDGGAAAIFEALAQSTVIERFSLRNNLIRNGLLIQTALIANPRLINLDIEYNDIELKVLTGIQRILRDHFQASQERQKDRIREICEEQAESEHVLLAVRRAIASERDEVESLTARLAATEDAKQAAEADRATRLANFEQELAEITAESNKALLEQRDRLDELRGRLGMLEAETGALSNKKDREGLNFSRDGKVLVGVEKEITALMTRAAEEKAVLFVRLKDTKAKYRDAQQGLILSREAVMEQEKMARLEEEMTQREAARVAKGGKKGKGKAKGKGKKKKAKQAEEPAEPKPASIKAKAATTKAIPIVPGPAGAADGPSSSRRPG